MQCTDALLYHLYRPCCLFYYSQFHSWRLWYRSFLSGAVGHSCRETCDIWRAGCVVNPRCHFDSHRIPHTWRWKQLCVLMLSIFFCYMCTCVWVIVIAFTICVVFLFMLGSLNSMANLKQLNVCDVLWIYSIVCLQCTVVP